MYWPKVSNNHILSNGFHQIQQIVSKLGDNVCSLSNVSTKNSQHSSLTTWSNGFHQIQQMGVQENTVGIFCRIDKPWFWIWFSEHPCILAELDRKNQQEFHGPSTFQNYQMKNTSTRHPKQIKIKTSLYPSKITLNNTHRELNPPSKEKMKTR